MLGVQQFDHTRFTLTAFSGLYLFGTNLEFSLAKKLLAADPGFFLGGGAALRNDFNLTSYFVCLFVCFFRILPILESRRSSQGGWGWGAHLLHPSPRSAP